MQCVSGTCTPTACACTNPDTCYSNTDCCEDLECVNGNCQAPCVPPGPGECSADNACCPGKICGPGGDCFDCPDGVGCSQCNKGEPGFGLGVCADVESTPGMATCGKVTCSAVCNAVCGTDREYNPSSCSNANGGGCQGVFSQFPDFPDFMGGPCCKCKTGECGNP